MHTHRSFIYSYTHSKYLPRVENTKRKAIYPITVPKLLADDGPGELKTQKSLCHHAQSDWSLISLWGPGGHEGPRRCSLRGDLQAETELHKWRRGGGQRENGLRGLELRSEHVWAEAVGSDWRQKPRAGR